MAGNNNAVFERQRGQRPEHAPRDPQGHVVEPGTTPDETTTVPVETAFEQDEAEAILFAAEAAIVANQTTVQRHGCVEQRRGLQNVDAAGNVLNATEMWRCQCGVKFQGATIKQTQELYMAHIRRYDPEVPAPRFKK